MDFMNSDGFILLNGRTPGDYPGEFTFKNTLGKSTVNLIWVNTLGSNLVNDMKIECTLTNSNQLLFSVRLNSNAPRTHCEPNLKPSPITQLVWNPVSPIAIEKNYVGLVLWPRTLK